MSPEFSGLRGIPIPELSLMRSRRSAAFLAFLIFACSLMLAACSKSEPAKNGQGGAGQRAVARPLLVFMTDFGTANDAVAICKAVMVGIAPDIRIMDITHQVTPFSIEEGARFLAGVSPYYPAGTVFVAVGESGGGADPKAVEVKSHKRECFLCCA